MPASSPFHRLAWPRRTDRLTVRPAQAEDGAAIWRYRRLPEVSEWLPSAPGTYEEFQERFERLALGSMLVCEREGVVVGELMVRLEDAWAQAEVAEQAAGRQAEVGYAFDPAHAGRGYATEAARDLLRLCFDELGVHRVTAACFADNVPSWRVLQRIGMRRESVQVRGALHRSGEWLDGYGYAILAEEWAALGGPAGGRQR